MKMADEQGLPEAPSSADWRRQRGSRAAVSLREDAGRSLAENLAEGLALSEFLSTFTGAARPR